MRLITLYNPIDLAGTKPLDLVFLEESCAKLGIDSLAINVQDFDYFALPELTENDMLYRAAAGELARSIEKKLINDTCKHFYTTWHLALRNRGASFYYHEKANLPSVATIPVLPKDRHEAKAFAQALGNFPIIVKAVGGQKGVGVMRADSLKSLVSICDFFRGQTTPVIMRKYIDHAYYGRLIVIGDSVVASNRTKVLHGDFRTNTHDNIDANREPYEFSSDAENIAVEAVRTLGLTFGGVDLLFDKDGSVYIAEVNFPTQFSFAQKLTGIEISTLMLEYLMTK